jgi:hypothetical protein
LDRLHYKPGLATIPDCGLRIGLDPRWETRSFYENDSRGNRWQKTYSTYTKEIGQALLNHPASSVMVPPFARIRVECTRASFPEDEAQRRAARLEKSFRERGDENIRSRTFSLAGNRWHAVERQRVDKGGFWFSTQHLYLYEQGVLFRVAVSVTTNGCAGKIQKLLSGSETHTITANGQQYRIKFEDVKLMRNGNICSQRRHEENRPFFRRVRNSIR